MNAAFTILVIDDDPKVANALARALRRDYDVVTETENRRALTRIEEGERFAVIVASMSTHDLSGAELHASVHAIDARQAEHMIFVGDAALTPESHEWLKSLENPQIMKPFETKVLRAAIAELLATDAQRSAEKLAPDEAVAVFARRFDLEALQRDPSPAAFVDTGGAILWVNAAWLEFGASNGADQNAIAPGKNYFEAIRGELGPWFTQIAASCLTSGGAFESDYECSSTSVMREFRMRMLPIAETGLLITHSLRVEHSHDREAPLDLYASRYVSANGFIVMCSNCRRVRCGDLTRWDWAPDWIAKAPAPVSHGLCHLCLAFYFG